MTPEEKAKFEEMYNWFTERKTQQLSYPVDDASQNALRALIGLYEGSTALTQVYVDSGSDSVTAPKAYARTILVTIGGVQYELPSLI